MDPIPGLLFDKVTVLRDDFSSSDIFCFAEELMLHLRRNGVKQMHISSNKRACEEKVKEKSVDVAIVLIFPDGYPEVGALIAEANKIGRVGTIFLGYAKGRKDTLDIVCNHHKVITSGIDCGEVLAEKRCEQTRRKRMAGCAHFLHYRCYQDVSNAVCRVRKTKAFPCGHKIGVPCSDFESFNGKCERKCEKYCHRGRHRCKGDHDCGEECPPCQREINYLLDCRHAVKKQCHETPPDKNKHVCMEQCVKLRPFCFHECPKKCHELCGPCEVVVVKTPRGCPRGHRVPAKCSEILYECTVTVEARKVPECGHVVGVPCCDEEKLTEKELLQMCSVKCRHAHNCGHECNGSCGKCFQGRFHAPCDAGCGRRLICAHICTAPCGRFCPPCNNVCPNACEHEQCEKMCGIPCERSCQEPCTYACVHSKCTNKCSEVCNKEICEEPCDQNLKCEHKCAGFCGEICPPFCLVCNPEKFTDGSDFGLEVSSARYIFLEECGHCIESKSLLKWISVELDEIRALQCPVCNVRMKWIRRYSAIFSENEALINMVRAKIFGTEADIQNTCDMTLQMITDRIRSPLFWIDNFVAQIKSEVRSKHDISLEKARYLEWLATRLITASETLNDFEDNAEKETFYRVVDFFHDFFNGMVLTREWPLSHNEIVALEREWDRLEDVIKLYSRVKGPLKASARRLIRSSEFIRVFGLAEDLLVEPFPYTERKQTEFLSHMRELDRILQTTLNITERERAEIIRAFGGESGRWFKCVNGHVYVVTECGGATQTGVCNECKARIGGASHAMLEYNYLASDMDGAVRPLYPTALRNPRLD